MKNFYLLLFVVCFTSCSLSKRTVTENYEHSPKKVLRTLNKTENQINFIQAKAKVSFNSKGKKKSNTITYRLSSNEKIWINASLGAARILINNDSIKYYNKLEKSFYKSDFNYVNDQIGIKADFKIFENLILAIPIEKLSFSNFRKKIDGFYTYENDILLNDKKVKSVIYVSPFNFKISKQIFIESDNKLIVYYQEYKKLKDQFIPTKISFFNNDIENLKIEIKSISAPEKLNTPFKIPKNYNRIKL